MLLSEFDYDLPEELIASQPLPDRDKCKLLVLKSDGSLEDRFFYELPELLSRGDLLVFNDTRVVRARVYGRVEKSGVFREFLFFERETGKRWKALVKGARKLKVGDWVKFDFGRGVVVEKGQSGEVIVEFDKDVSWEEIDKSGKLPLPPYIVSKRKREGQSELTVVDEKMYQTVFARNIGSVASPTASLHFTEELLDELRRRGIDHDFITLHVGLGTFQPLKKEVVEENELHKEFVEVSDRVVEKIKGVKERGGRIVAVGTTTVRALETASLSGELKPFRGYTSLFISVGFEFKVVDVLVTNFHLPRSSLLVLVSAFAGRERIMSAYRYAVEKRYRFYSYGDAMLIFR